MQNDRYFLIDFVKLGDALGIRVHNEETRQDLEERCLEDGIIKDILDLRVEGETLILNGGDAHGLEILESGACQSAEDVVPDSGSDNRDQCSIERD